MPKIVDKLQKRQDIALSSTELFVEKGFHKLTVSEVALNAHVAKGTIYEYFESKEDIVFAIIEYAQKAYDDEVLTNINNTQSIKEKVSALFSLCIAKDSEAIKRRKIYKEFIAIVLDEASDEMIKFQQDIKNKYTNWLKDILLQGIKDKKLKPEVLEFADGLFAMAEGVLMFSHIQNYFDENILQLHIDALFKLIQIGDDKK
ncbi:MAG: TetR/AcrR family transcriptional regulator [Arcobacteraceae bacterium]|nr:TetR/AcrR family transcriptional regulator [Arcobacteraceae bacterium]